MAILTKSQFKAMARSNKVRREKFADEIQEMLIAATYYAAKDNNADYFNIVIDTAGNVARKAGMVLWARTYAPVRVKDERFVMNRKTREETFAGVINEETFARFETELRATPRWDAMVPEEQVKDPFDLTRFGDATIKRLMREGQEAYAAAFKEFHLGWVATHASALDDADEAEEAAEPSIKLVA